MGEFRKAYEMTMGFYQQGDPDVQKNQGRMTLIDVNIWKSTDNKFLTALLLLISN